MQIFENKEKGYSVCAGLITSVTDDGSKVLIKLKDGKDIKTFVFADGVKRKLATRARLAKLAKGSYVSILYSIFQNQFYAGDFRFNGVWHYVDGAYDYNFVVAKVSFINYSDTRTNFKFLIKDNGKHIKINVSFFKNEKNKENFNKRCFLKEGDYLVCKCGKSGNYLDAITYNAFSVHKIF